VFLLYNSYTMTTQWIIADPHFGHAALVEKGYRAAGFEEKIIKSISNTTQNRDYLIILGDLFFGGKDVWFDYRKRFPSHGKYILVRGNHDKKSLDWYTDNGFDFAVDALVVRKYGFKVLLTHIPQKEERLAYYDLNIHGHLHNNAHRKTELCAKHVLYSAEAENYQPLSLQTLIERGKTSLT